MAIGRGQRDLIIGSVIEFLGIIMLAFRFGADRGGMPTLLLGAILIAIGLGLQIRAVARASRARVASDAPRAP